MNDTDLAALRARVDHLVAVAESTHVGQHVTRHDLHGWAADSKALLAEVDRLRATPVSPGDHPPRSAV